MKKLISFLLLLVVSGSVFAELPIRRWHNTKNTAIAYATPAEACAAGNNPDNGNMRFTGVITPNPIPRTAVSATCQMVQDSGSLSSDSIGAKAWYCAATGAVVPGNDPNYNCPTSNGICKAGDIVEATFLEGTSSLAAKLPTNGGNGAFASAIDGCAVIPVEVIRCYHEIDGSTKKYYCRYKFQETGAASSNSTVPATDDPTKADVPMVSPPKTGDAQTGKCPEGTMRIGTDSAGTPICAGQGTSPTAAKPPTTTTKTTNATAADGTKTKIETTERQNSDGSTTTTTKTTVTAPNGSVTTSEGTTTGSSATGGAGKPDLTEEEQSDFCKLNPQLNVCRNSSVAGDCEAVSCEGDAIQCAILKQQKKEYCENKTETSETTLGKSILGGTDSQQGSINALFAGTTVDLSSQSLDQGGFVGTNSCFPSKSISILGHTQTVSFTSVCNNIQPLRYAILACSLIVAYLLVSKSVLQG